MTKKNSTKEENVKPEQHYVGPDLVAELVDLKDGTTEVVFQNGSKEIYNTEVLKNVLSESAIDLTSLRIRRIQPIAYKAMELLMDLRLKIGEIDYFTQVLIESITRNAEEADRIKWGKNKQEVTLKDIEEVLLLNQQKQNGGDKSKQKE